MPVNNYSLMASVSLILWFYVFVRVQDVPLNSAVSEATFIAVVCAILYLSSWLIRRINAVLA
ncbi:hypothetical protein [Methanocella sp. MCL-LM]|uniref:hypothetical protein n=1 Tax=Methanocella sp. MCL-LM TaxID=3412035 RepID=UPI003C742E9A